MRHDMRVSLSNEKYRANINNKYPENWMKALSVTIKRDAGVEGLAAYAVKRMHHAIHIFNTLLVCICLLSPAYCHAGLIIDLGQTSSHATPHNDIGYDAKAVVLAWKWSSGIELSGGSLYDAPDRAATWASVSFVLTDPHLFAGIGIAVDDHVTSTLTSRFLFQTQAGFHYHHWRILVRHLSNAGLKGENIGETLILVGWEF